MEPPESRPSGAREMHGGEQQQGHSSVCSVSSTDSNPVAKMQGNEPRSPKIVTDDGNRDSVPAAGTTDPTAWLLDGLPSGQSRKIMKNTLVNLLAGQTAAADDPPTVSPDNEDSVADCKTNGCWIGTSIINGENGFTKLDHRHASHDPELPDDKNLASQKDGHGPAGSGEEETVPSPRDGRGPPADVAELAYQFGELNLTTGLDPSTDLSRFHGREGLALDACRCPHLCRNANAKEMPLDGAAPPPGHYSHVVAEQASPVVVSCAPQVHLANAVLSGADPTALFRPPGAGLAVPEGERPTFCGLIAADDAGLGDIGYVAYASELQMPDIMRLIQKDLSEPYSIYTYRYFIHNWPKLCFLAMDEDKCVGAIVCKLDLHKKVVRRGYIAMLAVDENYRKRKIGSNLVLKAIQAMVEDDADEVVLETEISNKPALKLYENLGFVRDKRLFRYYLNGVDALRLKLWLR